MTLDKAHNLQPRLSLPTSPRAYEKTQTQGLETEGTVGGPSGSWGEPEDSPEVTELPYPTPGSL